MMLPRQHKHKSRAASRTRREARSFRRNAASKNLSIHQQRVQIIVETSRSMGFRSVMKTFFFSIFITIALGLCACSSQERELSVTLTSTPSVGSCHETAVTQSDLNKCASQMAEATRVKLNALLDELRNHMEMTQYQKLISLQSEWGKAAEEYCQWEADFFSGGSAQPMWLAGCLEKQYRQRIDALRFNLCEGHGMTGECEAALRYQ